ncbi:TPA: hypothetical protein ACH3X1_015673 [Trebouxia sp. C0004]
MHTLHAALLRQIKCPLGTANDGHLTREKQDGQQDTTKKRGRPKKSKSIRNSNPSGKSKKQKEATSDAHVWMQGSLLVSMLTLKHPAMPSATFQSHKIFIFQRRFIISATSWTDVHWVP